MIDQTAKLNAEISAQNQGLQSQTDGLCFFLFSFCCRRRRISLQLARGNSACSSNLGWPTEARSTIVRLFFNGRSLFYQVEFYSKSVDDFFRYLGLCLGEKDWNVFYCYSNALRGIHQCDEAVKAVTRALELVPSHGKNALAMRQAALLSRSRALFGLGNYRATAQDVDDILKNDPNHIEALLGRAHAHMMEGRREKALPYLTHIIRVNPDNVVALNIRASVWSEQGNYAAALADYNLR